MNDITLISLNMTLNVNLNAIKQEFKVNIMRNHAVTTYLHIKEFDFCESLSAANSNYILKYLFAEVHRKGNFPTHCPLNKVKEIKYTQESTFNKT